MRHGPDDRLEAGPTLGTVAGFGPAWARVPPGPQGHAATTAKGGMGRGPQDRPGPTDRGLRGPPATGRAARKR
jgi:hypothetical protein